MIPINLSVYCGLKLMKFQIEVLVKEYIKKYVSVGAGRGVLYGWRGKVRWQGRKLVLFKESKNIGKSKSNIQFNQRI